MSSSIGQIIDGSLSLSDAQKQKIGERVHEIAVAKSQSIYDFVSSLRNDMTKSDASTREAVINELSAVLLQLPEDILTPDIANFLLEFLLPRVEDSGHIAAEFLVAVVQHLVLCCGKDLSLNVLGMSIGILYETNGVQSYAQRDRMRLFELLHYLLNRFLTEIKIAYDPSKLVVAFMRAANSERDPRCLLKIFRIFNIIARNFPLGSLAEDMFELIACYYPIDYEPSENDVGQISSEMLSAGCESCLLANVAFAPFCFQLISEKLLDQESLATADGDGAQLRLRQQLSVCKFLCKACAAFGHVAENSSVSPINHVRAELESYLTAFRLIAFNPAQTRETLATTRKTLDQTALALSEYFRIDEDSEKDHRFMATNSLENCEPFVLQAEMGLTGKALAVLEAIANSNLIAAEVIIPKVLYWFNVLLTGMTLKSPDNRQEVCEECLEFLPNWFEMAEVVRRKTAASNADDEYIKSYSDLFDAIDGLAEFCSSAKILRSKFDCARRAHFGDLFHEFILDESQTASSNVSRLCRHIDSLMERLSIFGDDTSGASDGSREEIDDAVVAAAVQFIADFSARNPAKCREVFEPIVRQMAAGQSEQHPLLPMFRVLSSSIHDEISAEWIVPALFRIVPEAAEKLSSGYFDVLTTTVKQIASYSAQAYVTFKGHFFAFLARLFDVYSATDTTDSFLEFLQDVGLSLTESQHDELAIFLLDKLSANKKAEISEYATMCWVVSPLISQSKSLPISSRFVDEVTARLLFSPSEGEAEAAETRLKRILVNLLFAICTRTSSNSTKRKDADKLASRIRLAICHCDKNILSSFPISAILEQTERIMGCNCGWMFAARVALTRSYLLNSTVLGIRYTSKLFDFCLNNSDNKDYGNCVGGARDLLDFFSSPINPIRCALQSACTLIWRQRIFCQFVPVYIEYFDRIGNANVTLKVEFLRMIELLFRLVKTIDRPMNHELKMLMPVLAETFLLISKQTGVDIDKRLLLDSTLELLRITTSVEELSGSSDGNGSPLIVFLKVFTEVLLGGDDENPEVVLRCLECLEVLAQKASATTRPSENKVLHTFHPRVVQGTIRQARSRKRLIRQHAANVRNLWELL